MSQGLTLGTRVRAASRAVIGIFSDHSLQQAYGLLQGVLPGGMGIPPTRGTAEFLKAYSQMPWLRAVASRIATGVAQADWQLYVVRKNGQAAKHDGRVKAIQRAPAQVRRRMLKQLAAEKELDQVLDHPLLDVLSKANDFQTGLAMRKVTQLHLDLVGDAFWLKERDATGTVIAVWPIPPNWIMATPTPVFRFFRVSFRAWRGMIPDTEWIWFSEADPLNPYGRGTGVTQALGDELETDEYAARHTKAFFYNSARPDLIISPKGTTGLNPANVERLEEKWLNQSQGFYRAFKPFFLNKEVDVKELNANFRNIQLVQLRQHERDTIMQVFGIPPEILGVLESSNRATIDAADYLMSRYVIEPRLEFLRSVLQERFAPEYDERLIVEFVSPVQDDRAGQLEAAKAMPGALSVDEWRKLSGHQPMEDEDAGALHFVSTTFKPTSIEDMVNPPEPVMVTPGAPGAPGAPKPAPKPPKRAMDLTDGVLLLDGEATGRDAFRADVTRDIGVALDADDKALADDLHRSIDYDLDELPPPSAAAARMEPGLMRTLVRTWSDYADRLDLGKLEAAFAPHGIEGDAITAINPTALAAAQSHVLEAGLARGVERGVQLGALALRQSGVQIKQVAVDLSGSNAEATRWAREHAAALVHTVADTREIIRQLVIASNITGIPPRELARLLSSFVGLTPRQATAVTNFRNRIAAAGNIATEVLERRVARYAQAQRRARALTIARTELIGALNGGQQFAWESAIAQGVIRRTSFQKVWIVTQDERLEAQCEALDGVQVPIEAPFEGGVMYPPLHPRCRCATGLVPVTVTVRP